MDGNHSATRPAAGARGVCVGRAVEAGRALGCRAPAADADGLLDVHSESGCNHQRCQATTCSR